MSKIKIVRTNSSHPDFAPLVNKLDNYLAVLDGSEHDFYHQFNNIDVLNHVVIAYHEGVCVGCGAFKAYDPKSVEIKRMFTDPNTRGMGVASAILTELEEWAQELGYEKSVLETGIKMPDAMGLYVKLGYHQVPNYGQYAGKELSRCFEKELKQWKVK